MARTPSTMLDLGTTLPSFRLTDVVSDQVFSSNNTEGKPILIVFMCNHCPFVIHLHDGLTQFFKDYSSSIECIAINSNDTLLYPQDGASNMKALVDEKQWNIKFLLDETQDVAKSFKAACTPDFFLFDANKTLVYRGQFDSSRPGNNLPVTGKDLRMASEAVLQQKKPSSEQIASLGCNIKWKTGNEPDYFSKRIS